MVGVVTGRDCSEVEMERLSGGKKYFIYMKKQAGEKVNVPTY